MLKIQNLYKEYQNTFAVRNISFEVNPGEIFGLLGPNGAGKTTTIRMILNIIRPTAGSITFYNQPMGPSLQSCTGYLPEERGLYKKSKVIDILRYLGGLKGMTAQKAIQEGRRWLERLNIENYGSRKLEELSKGNQQKVQFISSVIHNPKLLILDEPFSGFDPINQQIIKELIAEFVNSGKLIIISTHQMGMAEILCSRILVINKGEEILKGSLKKIKKDFMQNSFNIGFDGDGNELNHFPMIKVLSLRDHTAKIQPLCKDTGPAELLKNISGILDVNHFSAVEPSLYDIFLETVKNASLKGS